MHNPVLDAIAARRSIRAYAKEQITSEQLDAILAAGLAAPSARNTQPWHFTAVQDAALIAASTKPPALQIVLTCPRTCCARIAAAGLQRLSRRADRHFSVVPAADPDALRAHGHRHGH